jgi:acetyl-CoA carboxylase biotin carboxyl carrier protein
MPGLFVFQLLGRLPWLALLFLRAFFLRAFFAMLALLFVVRELAADRSGRVGASRTHPHPGRDLMTLMADEIRAEMVANVGKVVASPGATVAEGDTLVILEAMKMEIPVHSPFDGTVKAVHAAEGDQVAGGALLVELES